MFVLEGKENTIQRFPAVVNAIQGLQSQLVNDDSFSFRFGAVLTFNEPDNRKDPICKLTPDYMELLDFLSAKARNAEQLKPTYGRFDSWSGLGSEWSNSTNVRMKPISWLSSAIKGSTASGQTPPW